MSSTFRQTLFFIIPISVMLYVLRAQIVRVLLGSGQFDWYDTRLTAACLAIFCVGLFAQGAYPLVIRGFYALHNTKTPFFVGLATMVVNVAALLVFRSAFASSNSFSFAVTALLRLSDLWGLVDFRVLALPAAITVSSIFELVILLFALRRKIGRLDGRKIIDSAFRIIFASLGGGLVAYASLRVMDLIISTEKFYGLLAQGAMAGSLGIIGFIGISYIFKSEEMFDFVSSLKRKLLRKTEVQAEDSIAEGHGA